MAEEDAEFSRDENPEMARDEASELARDETSGLAHEEDMEFSRDDAGLSRPRQQDDGGGLGFSLPPISLPEVRFPERIRLVFPIPEPPEKVSKPTRVRVSRVLLAVVLVDALDALAVALVGPAALPWARTTLGTLLSILLAGPLGLLYPWELMATLGGYGWFTLAPTLTLLVLARMVLSQ